MTTIFDVANYILQNVGPMTSMKLQKLVYYSQAWSLVWDESPLFGEDFQAWAFGPVCLELYEAHKNEYELAKDRFALYPGLQGLSVCQAETVDAVIRTYNVFSGQQLSDLTHSEAPWNDAREGVEPLERSTNVINKAAMSEFYTTLAGQPT
jgi:uncharacterized phage-associated protein